jgi:hypothetical protein
MATEAERARLRFAVDKLYEKYLGRAPEQAGIDYWMREGEYANLPPLTPQEIEWNIANSQEAQDRVAETELDIFEDTTADDTTADAGDGLDTGERLYDYTNNRETGGSQNLYWNNFSRQLTLDELEAAYYAQDNARTREAFGSWDNYLAYMNERQDLIDAGEYKADWWDRGVALVDPEGLGRDAGMDDRALEGSIIDEGVRQAQIGYGEQEDVFTDLYEKYTGESVVKYLDNGAKYEWNGTSFVMTQEAYGYHFGTILGETLPGIVIGAGLGPAGADIFGVAGAGSGAARGAVSSMLGQYVTTGSVDPGSVAQSAVLGGIGGFFDDIVAADPGTYGGWVVNGQVVGAPGQFAIEKIQYLSNALGIPFTDAAGIVEGILTGAVKGQDFEGIVLNAVGGWGSAKVNQYIQNTLGDAGLDVDNFFREGSTNISTEAIQSLVDNGIQGLVDGGMSPKDVFVTLYDFFDEGGSLDFLWPSLGKLDIDIDADFPNFCDDFPNFPLCSGGTLPGIDLPKVCKEDAQGEKPWYCSLGLNGSIGVDVDLPDVDLPEVDIQVCSDEQKANGGIEIKIGDPDSWYCQMPDIPPPPDVELCSEEELNNGGYTVRIGSPDSWYCNVPDIDIQVCSDEEKAQGGVEIKIGNPDSWYCKMPDVDPEIELCSEEELNQGGYTVRIGDRDSWYCNVPEIDIEVCTEEQLSQGGVEIKIGNPDSWYCKMPEIDIEVCTEEQLSQGGIEIKIGNPDSWYCKMPELPDIQVCSDEELAKGGKEIRIGDPDSWYCQMPEIPDIVVCSDEQKAQGGKEIRIGDPSDWYCQMPEITLPCPPTKVRNEQTGECECPAGKEENAFGLCVDPDDSCPTGQQRDPETGECVEVDVDTPDVDTPDVDIDFGFTVPQQPMTDNRGMLTGTTINQDAQLLTRTQFPIRDFLAEALPKTKQNTGMMTGFKA